MSNICSPFLSNWANKNLVVKQGIYGDKGIRTPDLRLAKPPL